MANVIKTDQKPGNGCYSCTNCHTEVNLDESDKMPPCPRCSNNGFTKK